MGTGSIAGVATALTLGGPGAVFWMWVSALLGMMTGFGEKLLAVRFQRPAPGGGMQGGPMFYLRDGLGWKGAALWFTLACLPATLAGGDLVQSSSIAQALESSFALPRLGTGLFTAVLAGLVLMGGVGRIARVSAALVPAMALLYLGVKNIHLGPTLPAFLSPNVAKVLVENFGIAGIRTVEEDMAFFFGGQA